MKHGVEIVLIWASILWCEMDGTRRMECLRKTWWKCVKDEQRLLNVLDCLERLHSFAANGKGNLFFMKVHGYIW